MKCQKIHDLIWKQLMILRIYAAANPLRYHIRYIYFSIFS
ncbi:hypothetical protein THIOSC13_750005 [uncultured Thiomicrorhabdus sp.]